MSRRLVDLGWVDFDLGVPPSCPAAQPLLPSFLQSKQNWAERQTVEHSKSKSTQPSPPPDGTPCTDKQRAEEVFRNTDGQWLHFV